MSEKTGCEIAYHRAIINSLRDHRDELKIKLAGLKEYYYTMNQSKYFNEENYEIRRLNTHMTMLQDEIDIIKELIEKEQDFLKQFMEDKAEFYKKIRRNRKADLNQ